LHKQLYQAYEKYKEQKITDRRFKHDDIEDILDQYLDKEWVTIKTVGKSIEGRNINLVSLGNGPTQVLLWSQMHGDEPTATMALMDILQFFDKAEGDLAVLRDQLLENISIHMLPMLNPDGAERFQRRNALNVDLNRDALRLENPETKTLKRIRDSLDAEWGFNLHDQNRYYGAGMANNIASISFLAPAYNYEKEVNGVRGKSMQLIVAMNEMLQDYIPNKVAKYSDDFEPRAFGDNMQKWGTSTILIESGGLEGDREKQELRKLHFMIIVGAFEAIANKRYESKSKLNYELIPFNESNLFHDLLLRKVNVSKLGKTYVLDLAFRYNEIEYDEHRKYYLDSSIRDIGDLSTAYAYDEYDMSAYQTVPGKVYPETFKSLGYLQKKDLKNLLKEGYTTFRLKEMPAAKDWINRPYVLIGSNANPEDEIAIGSNPSLIFKNGGKVEKFLVNGQLYDLKSDADVLKF
jgi:hypothetical protein